VLEQFISFVQEWGYWAVFFGSLIEGESVILTASSMAAAGYLSLPKIMIIAFLGTLTADQVLYAVGRAYGPSIFEKFPRLNKSSEKAFKLLHRYDALFIIVSRFVYGIRITSAVVIGAGGVPPHRYIPLNFISAFIWTLVSCLGGYMLGDVMISIIENFELVQKYLLIGLFIFVILVAGFMGWRKKKNASKI
jgi:membrane protein DedA with SNARE-associated domain